MIQELCWEKVKGKCKRTGSRGGRDTGHRDGDQDRKGGAWGQDPKMSKDVTEEMPEKGESCTQLEYTPKLVANMLFVTLNCGHRG